MFEKSLNHNFRCVCGKREKKRQGFVERLQQNYASGERRAAVADD